MPLPVKYSTETYYLLMVMHGNCSGFCEAVEFSEIRQDSARLMQAHGC
jgi:hypothetical protein